MNDWEKAIAFHGHSCCVLASGYRAALKDEASTKYSLVKDGRRLCLDCAGRLGNPTRSDSEFKINNVKINN